MDTKTIGLSSELHCMTYFTDLGYGVSVPLGDNLRYDLIVDYKNVLFRVQVKKSSIWTDGVISFSCRSTVQNSRQTRNRKYSPEEIDCFATFWDGVCYIVPVEEASTQKNLHLGHPKNGQVKGVNFASDYIAEKQLEKMYQKHAALVAACFFIFSFFKHIILKHGTIAKR